MNCAPQRWARRCTHGGAGTTTQGRALCHSNTAAEPSANVAHRAPLLSSSAIVLSPANADAHDSTATYHMLAATNDSSAPSLSSSSPVAMAPPPRTKRQQQNTSSQHTQTPLQRTVLILFIDRVRGAVARRRGAAAGCTAAAVVIALLLLQHYVLLFSGLGERGALRGLAHLRPHGDCKPREIVVRPLRRHAS